MKAKSGNVQHHMTYGHMEVSPDNASIKYSGKKRKQYQKPREG